MKRMLGGAAAVALGLTVAVPATGQVLEDTARVHVVRRGDTLWDLARRYLENPFLWPRIHEANPGVVENPHWIYPTERLLIPGLSGFRGAEAGVAPGPGQGDPRFREMLPEDYPRTVFFPDPSTEGRTLLGPDDTPSATVARGEFYSAGLLLQSGLPALGRLVEVISPTIVPVGRQVHPLPYEKVYMVIASPDAIRRGQHVQLMAEGRTIRPFGTMYQSTGIAQVLEIDGLTATLEIQEHFGPVAVGNLAVPLPEYSVPLSVRPEPVSGRLEGRLIAFQTEEPVHAVRDYGFVDLGRSSGLTEGDVLEAILDAERRSWGVRPEIRIAQLRVVRVGERTSAVQVISMEHPAIEPGMTVRLIAKMPAS